MKSNLKISVRRITAICVMVAGVFFARAEEEVLWWQVPDDPDVRTVRDGVKPASEIGITDARIRVWEGDTLGGYLLKKFHRRRAA